MTYLEAKRTLIFNFKIYPIKVIGIILKSFLNITIKINYKDGLIDCLLKQLLKSNEETLEEKLKKLDETHKVTANSKLHFP